MARVITAVERPDAAPRVFLAGGISNCPDWQAEVIRDAADLDVSLYNPRRPGGAFTDDGGAADQIRWEFQALNRADLILFWFCAETIQPIVLFELGRWSATTKPLVVGAHPSYPRRLDVVEQLALVRPQLVVTDTLTDLTTQLRKLLT